MHDMIKEILRLKREEIKSYKKGHSINNIFLKALQKKDKIALIAELKFASPSAGILGSPADLLTRAKIYEQARVVAISVITEKHFFHGDPQFVTQVKKHTSLPVLQKDFIIDERQIYQAREIGADALLLIARIIDKEKLKQFVHRCHILAIEPVVEVHAEEDLDKAMATETKIIAVNARDLDTFIVDVAKACLLLQKIPDQFIKLGFSGVNGRKEVESYGKAGAQVSRTFQ